MTDGLRSALEMISKWKNANTSYEFGCRCVISQVRAKECVSAANGHGRELINKRRPLNGFIFSHGHFSHDFPSLSALSPPALEEAVSDSVASGQSYIHWTEGL